MGSGKFISVKLHEHKELITKCAEVMNEEWQRSLTARCLMLEKSNDQLPYCIVLLERSDNETVGEVIGHSRLCKVYGVDNSCYVESVVIAKKKRGQGLGRVLMEESEKHAKTLGCRTLYLTTHDKQDFYAHLDYVYCEPIVSFGSASNLISDEMAKAFMKSTITSSPLAPQKLETDKCKESREAEDRTTEQNNCADGDSAKDFLISQPHPPPPTTAPPPPPPPPPSVPPPPPPPSVPPPPPPPPSAAKTLSTVSRMHPSSVYWMKKVLDD